MMQNYKTIHIYDFKQLMHTYLRCKTIKIEAQRF